MIPIPISTPQIFVLALFAAFVLFIVFFLPAILELRKPKDAGPRRIFEADGKEVIGFDILFAVYFREKTSNPFGFLEDIESPETVFPVQNSFSLALPDMEF